MITAHQGAILGCLVGGALLIYFRILLNVTVAGDLTSRA
jgi:hypothetical protein